jgi:hypothetical protein
MVAKVPAVNKEVNPLIDQPPPIEDKTTGRPETSIKKKRLNLDLTIDAYETLQKLTEESGKNMAEVLRAGLALYYIAQEEKKKERSLAIVQDEKIVKEIIIV